MTTKSLIIDLSMAPERLVMCFMPSLVATLAAREREKGSPLTEAEVLAIRDSANVVMVPLSAMPEMIARRGYEDIDPEDCWAEWTRIRITLP